METKKTSFLYKIIKALVYLFYPRTRIIGAETLPDEPVVIVGNHTQMNGPIVSELYIPGGHATWCAAEMMDLRDVPDYAYRDFWSEKPGWIRWFYRLLSYVIAPISVCVFNNAETIPVYHDARIVTTFRMTIARLRAGDSVVIFPEHGVPHNHILYEFQEKFIDVARFYYKQTGQALAFVPLYVAPARREAYLGEPIRFRPDEPIAGERSRVSRALMDAITDMADSLPLHTVVPYLNLPRKSYPTNHPREVSAHEKADG